MLLSWKTRPVNLTSDVAQRGQPCLLRDLSARRSRLCCQTGVVAALGKQEAVCHGLSTNRSHDSSAGCHLCATVSLRKVRTFRDERAILAERRNTRLHVTTRTELSNTQDANPEHERYQSAAAASTKFDTSSKPLDSIRRPTDTALQSSLPVGSADAGMAQSLPILAEATALASTHVDDADEQPPEVGIVDDAVLIGLQRKSSSRKRSKGGRARKATSSTSSFPLPREDRNHVADSWNKLMRWSRLLSKKHENGVHVLDRTVKVVIFGGGSFGTAIAAALARQKETLSVTLLLRDPYVCKEINTNHRNTKYLTDFSLPPNVSATTSAAEAISGAQFAVHAVPVQHTRSFLTSIKDLLPSSVPIISVSKGLEVGSGMMMHDLIPASLGRKQPTAFISGPSFAKEVMLRRPTGVVAAAKDAALAREVQQLFASSSMRVNTSRDVVGVEICGALKNVLAIAAGIVEGLQLGNNAMAALVAQGCAEIRWLAEKMGAKSTTVSGLSGLGDIMLTCYGDLSRNRSVGIRLGRGEKLKDILAASTQVAEGVATASVVVTLANKYKVSLPVLTAVAQILDNNIDPREAVFEIMNLPQIEER